MLGAADMAFPRLNALSFWLLPIAGVILVAGMVTPGGGPSAGWTCYAPLCSHQPLGQVFFNMGVQWAGASSIMTALNFLVTIITVVSRRPVFGYRVIALSLMAILVLGFSVWAHHMFVAGMAGWLRVPMMVTSMVIAVPTGIKIFSWLATMWEGRLHFTTPMLFALGFLSMFVIGGLSGIYLASVPIDIHASDTYFI